jgi:AI-2 transport protein TqsA
MTSSATPRSITIPLLILALIALGATLHLMQPVLLPFVVALFLTNLFRPLVAWLRRMHVPMAVALLIVMLVVGGVMLALGLVAITSVQSLIAALPRYEARWNTEILPWMLSLLDSAPDAIRTQVRSLQWSNIVQVSAIVGVVFAGAGGFLSVVSNVGLILLYMLFILSGQGLFGRKLRDAYPEHADELSAVIKRIDERTERYFITVTVMNLVTGIITLFVLWAFGLDLALLWAIVTFLVAFIPTIGSIITLALPILVAFLQFSNPITAVWLALTLIAVQFLWGSVLTPRLMGSRLDLSPLLVLLSLLFWGWVWGPWGMILSVPITSMIKIALESVPETKPIAVLMSAKGNSSVKAT